LKPFIKKETSAKAVNASLMDAVKLLYSKMKDKKG